MALDTTPEAVGLTAARRPAVLYEIDVHEHFDLEELFLELTTTKESSMNTWSARSC